MGRFIQNFLSHRSFRVRVGSHLSDSFSQENGIPQGGVLSVVLFAVMINDICDDLPATIGKSLYADDLAVWYAASIILQWHCRGLKCYHQDLQTVLRWRSPLIVGLLETKLSPAMTCAMKGYAI